MRVSVGKVEEGLGNLAMAGTFSQRTSLWESTMSVRMWPAAKDLPVFAQVAVRLLDALDERLPARSRPSNTGSLRKIPFSAERALRIYSPEPVAARPDVEVSRGI
jgi:hypothetical protein